MWKRKSQQSGIVDHRRKQPGVDLTLLNATELRGDLIPHPIQRREKKEGSVKLLRAIIYIIAPTFWVLLTSQSSPFGVDLN